MDVQHKRSVVYQIYTKSFYSHAGKATGDLAGVIEKLDYLQWLGVDYLWLTPFFQSPQRDHGYDISDYYTVDPLFGSNDDLERLIGAARLRGIGIILDIVVNHTSTEHPWFRAAQQGRDNPYRDFYLWRDTPNRWQSKFGHSAWERDEASGQYYLHLFDKSQADLNWDNPLVREAVYDMMRFWVGKGVAGFRLDVINLISKPADFPDDDGDGRRFYTDGPHVHAYLQEMHREVFSGHELLTVGEMSSTTIEHCLAYTHPLRRELTMTFSFHHLKVDYPQGEKWTAAPFDFVGLKRIMSDWQEGMAAGGGWSALFWCNHDQPRVVSRFGDDGQYRQASAKMLACVLHGLRGTPFIYQGEEIAMGNPRFDDIACYRDVETLNAWDMLQAGGVMPADAMAAIKQKSRDNARTPMQWKRGAFGGFSSSAPWIDCSADADHINVETAMRDPGSVLHCYRQLIAFRKQYPVFTDGDYRCLTPDHPAIWAYLRTTASARLLVIANFRHQSNDFSADLAPLPLGWHWRLLYANWPDARSEPGGITLRPFEVLIYLAEYG
jgi:trehalose-6-phosphate hydrolase